MRKDVVIISGYLANGKLAYEQAISLYDWYEEEHSLINKKAARAFYKIARIQVRQYDHELDQEVSWESNYDASGEIIHAWKLVGGERLSIAVPGRQRMPSTEAVTFVRDSAGEMTYREAWFTGGMLYRHEGTVGEHGKTVTSVMDYKTARNSIADFRKQALQDQYTERNAEMLTDLVIVFEADEARMTEQLEIRHALEEKLDNTLGWTGNGECVGGDIGGGTLQIFCRVLAPDKAIPMIHQLMQPVKSSFRAVRVTREVPES